MAKKEDGPKAIKHLFEKYKNRLTAPEGVVIDAVVELIHDFFGVKVKKEEISYTPSSRTLHLNTNSQLKTEIILKKEEVLTHLRARLGRRNAPRDII